MRDILKLIFSSHGVDKVLYLVTGIIAVFGLIMIGDASVGMSVKYGSGYATMNMVKQVIFLGGGVIAMVVFAGKFNSKKLTYNLTKITYLTCLALMIMCLAWNVNGSHAWIRIGSFASIQPAEFMKVALILFLSYSFGTLPSKYKFRGGSLKHKTWVENQLMKNCLYIPFGAIMLAFMVCGFIQKDLGSALITGAISFVIFMAIPGTRYDRIKKLVLICLVVGVVFLFAIGGAGLLEHQLQRFVSWLHPLSDTTGDTYQIVNGLVAFSNGGLIGKGFGNSIMKYGYIPESQNDFIIAIIVEEFGLLGFTILLFLYSVIIVKLFRYALKMKDTTDKLILIGIASYFFFHLFVNVGGVSGLIPMTGVPLLLVSAGGTSTVVALICIGIAQGIITRYNRNVAKEAIERGL